MGLTLETIIASICSVTLIVAISDAIEEPIIKIIANPDMITPASRTMSIATSKPT